MRDIQGKEEKWGNSWRGRSRVGSMVEKSPPVSPIHGFRDRMGSGGQLVDGTVYYVINPKA